MKSGELREVYDLSSVGRIKYQSLSLYHKLLETVVRHDKHSILQTSLTLDLLIAGDFLKTSKSGYRRAGRHSYLISICYTKHYILNLMRRNYVAIRQV